MSFFGSISEFMSFISVAAVSHVGGAHSALEHAAKKLEEEAKAAIGEYQEGWAPLAETTLEGWHGYPGKIELGYSPPDNPLLRTGELRDSISGYVQGLEAVVGSTSDVALWQELGTAKIPPRSFLAATMIRHEEEIVRMLGRGALKGFIGEEV